MFAFDTGAGILIDANPAAEALSGYSRDELIGTNLINLHPQAERERVRAEFLEVARKPSRHPGFHIQRKDGQCAPVSITSSKTMMREGRSVAIYVYSDITEQEEQKHVLSTQNWALEAYAITALALGQVRSSESVLLQTICEAITHESIYVLAWLGIAEDGPDKPVRIVASAGSALGYLDGLHLNWSEDGPGGRGPTGICIRTGELQIMKDSETTASFRPWRERARQFGIRSEIILPLNIRSGKQAALAVFAADPNAFEATAIETFRQLADQIVHGVHALDQEQALKKERDLLVHTQKQLAEALSAVVVPTLAAMEKRDPYTAGHESRVAEIAVAIGKKMSWPEDRLQGLRVSAMVHDIGKISIPAEILTKPTRLSVAEWALVREHPESGYIILKDVPFAWPVAEIVRQHHERLDGSGYPLGLKGDAILPEAKVLAVADIVEAMASHRPYRPAIKMNVVLQQIKQEAGRSLDAEAVRACVALFRQKGLALLDLNRS
jgi:PAS domain S-box-containing protein